MIQGAAEKGGPVPRPDRRAGPRRRGRSATWATTWPTCPCSRPSGLAACPADAAAEVRAVAHLVAGRAGGRGAVREVVEIILKHQGVWDRLIETYLAPA